MRCVAEKMLTYALGRGLECYDRRAVNTIVDATGQGERPVLRPPDRDRQERPVPETDHPGRSEMKTPLISRRTVLRGLGTAVALPLLDAMLPGGLGAAPAAARPPRRMAFIYTPNGAYMPYWMPKTEGADFELTPCLEPMAEHRKDMIVFGGLTCDKARANGDGAGDHARASGSFLTGAQAKKTAGANFQAGAVRRPARRPAARRPDAAAVARTRPSRSTAGPATATAGTRASTSTPCRGGTPPRRCRRR